MSMRVAVFANILCLEITQMSAEMCQFSHKISARTDVYMCAKAAIPLIIIENKRAHGPESLT